MEDERQAVTELIQFKESETVKGQELPLRDDYEHIDDGKSDLRKWIDGFYEVVKQKEVRHEGCKELLERLNQKAESKNTLNRSELKTLQLTLGKIERIAAGDWNKLSTRDLNELPKLQRLARDITTLAANKVPGVDHRILVKEASQGHSEEWQSFIVLSPQTQLAETVQTIEETTTDRISDATTVKDISSYVPAKTLLDSTEEVENYNDLRKVLKDNPQIKRENKSRFRLVIDPVSWFDYWKKYRIKMFELTTNKATQGYIKGIEKTKEEIRQNNQSSNC